MYFDLKFLLRMTFRSFFDKGGINKSLSYKRIIALFIMLPIFLAGQIIHRICMFLDTVLYSEFSREDFTTPVFIVGAPRSGTTFIHRLMAKDSERFTSMMLWELLFAPSIIQKKVLLSLGAFDRAILGGWFKKQINKMEDALYAKQIESMHKTSFDDPEEDGILLMHTLANVYSMFFYPFEDRRYDELICFDDQMPETDKKNIMTYYRECLQRHLFVFGRGRQLLSKNPTFSSKVKSLMKYFPGAKIICTVRSPLNVVPSTISLHSTVYELFHSPEEKYPMQQAVWDMLAHWYRYPVKVLEQEYTEDQQAVINYEDLTSDPKGVIKVLYQRFGFDMDNEYDYILTEVEKKQQNFTSAHDYSMENIDISREEIVSEFADIFERFGFETGMEHRNKKPA